MIRYLKKYWPFAVLAALFMIGEVSVDLYQPRMMETIVDEGILGVNNNGVADLQLVISTGIRMILIVILGGTSGVLCSVFTNITGLNYGNALRKELFSRMMHFSFEQTDYFSSGSLITRVTSDVTQVQNMVMQFTRGLVRCLMFLIGGSFALLTLDMSFRNILLIAIPIILIEVILIVWKTNPLFTLLQERLDAMNSIVQENIAGARVVKAFVQEKRENERFEKTNQNLVETQLRVLLLLSWMRPIMNIVLNIAIVAIIKVGEIQVQSGVMAPGTIMAAITYISQILNGMMMMAMIFQTLSRGFASSKRMKEVLSSVPAIQDGNAENIAKEGSIIFDHVTFQYPSNKEPVLNDLSFEIKPGETVAIIGTTGSGKSTLVSLIPRFYDTISGKVYVDHTNVKDFHLDDLRERIAFVMQKSQLFSTTIKDNIAIGNRSASINEIRQAAVNAQADSFIKQQKDGYDTEVAEGGMSLSGGQRQRIAIARALLKHPEIMIFDDATSALDLATDAAFQDALKKHYADCTKIIIAQRVASVMKADRILVLEDGQIAGFDTHDNLMKNCEPYIDIYDSQLKKEA